MEQRVGVVTGAAGDIGTAVATALGARGYAVLCVERTEALAKRAADAVTEAGGEGIPFVADVTVEGDVTAYAAEAQHLWGRADFFFNNAGIEGAEKPLASYPADDWDRVMSVNLRGVFLGLKAMSGPLRHSDLGRVVNTASVAGLAATPMLAAYGASKHAVIGLTKTAAVEFAPLGIAVNAICPGPVESAMMKRIEAGVAPGGGDAARKAYEANVPQGRYAKVEEVADLAVYLLSDSPMYLSGQAIALDGGLSIA